MKKFNSLKNISLSLLLLVGVAGILIFGTSAFFSDTETSVGNVLAAGDIDLQVSNTSFYNGAPESSQSWTLNDLTDQLFFNSDFLNDLKPGDFGEDVIGLSVTSNDAYVCMDVDLTATAENGINDAEAPYDLTGGANEGELQDFLTFAFWADDGDNVLEDDEVPSIFVNTLPLNDLNGQRFTLADSASNIWGEAVFPGNETRFVGKAWCFGTLTLNPVEDNGSIEPTSNAFEGVLCDGSSSLLNAAQTDSVELTLSLDAIQARNNEDFLCNPITVNDGAFDATSAAGVRYKGNNTGGEVYLGVNDLGIGGNRVEFNRNWVDGAYDFVLSHDTTDNSLFTSINNPNQSLTFDFDVESATPACSPEDWDTLQIALANRKPLVGLDFTNVLLNGIALGDFNTVANGGWYIWNVEGFDFSQDWTLTGLLSVANFGDNENNKLEITVGCSL